MGTLDEKGNYMEDENDRLRSTEHNVCLNNKQIIELAYLCKDVIEVMYGKKLFFEQANCYLGCFYHIRKLLKKVTPEYLKLHEGVVSFFTENGGLSNDWDRLYFEKKNTEAVESAECPF